MDQLGEHPAQPDAHHERAFPGFNMGVARAGVDGVKQEKVDQNADLDPLLRRFGLKILNGLIHEILRYTCLARFGLPFQQYFSGLSRIQETT